MLVFCQCVNIDGTFQKHIFIPTDHPQYNELFKEVRKRGSMGGRGYFYGTGSDKHVVWFDTALASPLEDW
jgi:hypothetical protein